MIDNIAHFITANSSLCNNYSICRQRVTLKLPLSLLILSRMQRRRGADDIELCDSVLFWDKDLIVTHFLTPTCAFALFLLCIAFCVLRVGGVIFHDVLFATLYTCVQRRERAQREREREREYAVVLVWEIRERPLRHKEYKVVILPLATSATPTSGALMRGRRRLPPGC